MGSDDKGECKLAVHITGMMTTLHAQEEEWAADANLFISHEDDDTQVYSVRVAVFDLFSVRFNRPMLVVPCLTFVYCYSLFWSLLPFQRLPQYTLPSSVWSRRPARPEKLGVGVGT